ncbi:MAG: NitT/TauT family transport system permease protein [Chloroflexota bacterium]|nr:NitT/TauT family transport system permease protein [Chloroflexota bacterium]
MTALEHGPALRQPAPGRAGRGMGARVLRFVTSPVLVAPLVVAVAILAVWQAGAFHALFNIKTFTLPYPTSIGEALSKAGPQISTAVGATLPAALIGYAVGMSLGLLVASLLVRFAPRSIPSLLPVLSASNAIPIVALAPVLALWVDPGIGLKVVVVTVMTVPTMVIYAVRGLSNVEPNALELMDSIEASRNQVYRMVRVPTALPFVFTALKSSVVLALIGTIVTESIRGFEGLGFVIADSLSRFDAPKAWLALVVIAAMGICWYVVVEVLERVALPWESASRQRT